MHQNCLNWFAEGRSSYDKAKLYLGKSHIAVIIAVDRRIGEIVMMSLRGKI